MNILSHIIDAGALLRPCFNDLDEMRASTLGNDLFVVGEIVEVGNRLMQVVASDADPFHEETASGVRFIEAGPIFSTLQRAAQGVVAATTDRIETLGYAEEGDGGGAVYTYRATEPTHAGKVLIGGRWFEYSTEGGPIDPRAFGAVGDGVTDCSAAFKAAFGYGWTKPTLSIGGWRMHITKGKWLLAQNNVFDVAHAGQRRHGHFTGEGPGASVLVFRPTTGTSAFGDNKYYLFDGGDGDANHAALVPQYLTFSGLTIELDADDMASGDELWAWRMDGTGAAQGLAFTDAWVKGPGSAAVSGVKSGVLDITGQVNGNSNYFTRCRITHVSHILRSSNPQAVITSVNDCDVESIFADFFVIEDGALEIQTSGGNFIWTDNPDVTEQYLINVTAGNGTGVNNSRALFSNLKAEMRPGAARLVKCEQNSGMINIVFSDCNLAGGGISGVRPVTSLGAGKVVAFRDCTIPAAFGFHFTALDSALNATGWSLPNMGLVTLDRCNIASDISGNITQVGSAGRVIASGCTDQIGLADGTASPRDFDSNPFGGGHGEPGPATKRVSVIPARADWSDGKIFAATLPHGARLERIRVYRKGAGTDETPRTLTVSDGNGDPFDVQTASEKEGFELAWDAPLREMSNPRLTTADRTISVTVDQLGQVVREGKFLIDYI